MTSLRPHKYRHGYVCFILPVLLSCTTTTETCVNNHTPKLGDLDEVSLLQLSSDLQAPAGQPAATKALSHASRQHSRAANAFAQVSFKRESQHATQPGDFKKSFSVERAVRFQPHNSQLAATEDRTESIQATHRRSQHYWPQPRGGPGHESRTSYGLPQTLLKSGNLTDALAWTWEHPELGLEAIVWGTLIDKDKNIYITAMQGIWKYNTDGKLLWKRDDLDYLKLGSIAGNALYTMTMQTGMLMALDLDTGDTIWSRQVADKTGSNGDMVTSNNGIIIAAAGENGDMGMAGSWSAKVIGVDASTGKEIWSHQPDCGLWDLMALFPDEDTCVVMDSCGGLYRLGLYNGTELWKRQPDPDAWTDGGATLGPDNSIYTCTNEPHSLSMMLEDGLETVKGRVRKFEPNTGELVWERETEEPCTNFPAVSRDGKTLVLSDGNNVLFPVTRTLSMGMNMQILKEFSDQQIELLENKSQNSWWGQDNVNASILGYDTQTGNLKWQHRVEPYWGLAFARDEERSYNYVTQKAELPHCGPPHWQGPTIDDAGNIYIGRSSGHLYVYNPDDDSEVRFHTNDGMLMAGASFAPGLMVVPSCSFVYVFKY